jgi:transcriptional regulator with XRE-family HTH domain
MREKREELGLSTQAVANEISYNRSSVSRFETGEFGPPGDDTIEIWAKFLGIPLRVALHEAGRGVDAAAFQERVLDALEAILDEQRAGFERLSAAIDALPHK